jgi:serine phosphatase RsbU (regulator of sigma subunit)
VDIPHVQVILDQNQVPGALRTALNRVKARVSLRSLDKALADGISPTADICVILPRKQSSPDVLDRILANATERACATLVLESTDELVGEGAEESAWPAPCPQGPSATINPGVLPDPLRRLMTRNEETSALNADELTGRIKALCEIRSPMRRMSEELARLRRRDAEGGQDVLHLDEQLRLAGQIQRDLLPGTLPDTSPLTIETLYLPANFVSGDTYDVSRLDEDHSSFSVADATGHGLPAALLTTFVKNSFRGKEVTGTTSRILEPDEVLRRLNAELFNARLSGGQFITGLHAVFTHSTGQIRWARGGLPYPVLVRAGQAPRRLASYGGLMGAFESADFEVVSHQFAPGDTLLFFTDGLEALLLRHDEAFSAGNIEDSTWIRRLIEAGAAAAIQEIRELATRTPDEKWRKDDITLLVVSMASQ